MGLAEELARLGQVAPTEADPENDAYFPEDSASARKSLHRPESTTASTLTGQRPRDALSEAASKRGFLRDASRPRFETSGPYAGAVSSSGVARVNNKKGKSASRGSESEPDFYDDEAPAVSDSESGGGGSVSDSESGFSDSETSGGSGSGSGSSGPVDEDLDRELEELGGGAGEDAPPTLAPENAAGSGAGAAAATASLKSLCDASLRSRILLQRLLRPLHDSFPCFPLMDQLRSSGTIGQLSGDSPEVSENSAGAIGEIDGGLAEVAAGVASFLAGAVELWDGTECGKGEEAVDGVDGRDGKRAKRIKVPSASSLRRSTSSERSKCDKAVDALWEEIDGRYEAWVENRDRGLDTWTSRLMAGGGAIGDKEKAHRQLKAVGRNFSTQVAEVVNSGGVRERTAGKVGQGKTISARMSSGTKRTRGEAEEETGGEPEPNLEIYDDADLYERLLRDLITGGGGDGDGSDPVAMSRRAVALRSLIGRGRKKDVDRKASKGRKLRFQAHDKIVGFTAPEPSQLDPSEADALADALFANLFGQRVSLRAVRAAAGQEQKVA